MAKKTNKCSIRLMELGMEATKSIEAQKEVEKKIVIDFDNPPKSENRYPSEEIRQREIQFLDYHLTPEDHKPHAEESQED